MAAWRIGGSIVRGFRSHSRLGSALLCTLALLAALTVVGLGLRRVHAAQSEQQPQSQSNPQTDQQPGSQADSQTAAQSDTSSDADSNLNDPPPVLPTDPPGWKPEPW